MSKYKSSILRLRLEGKTYNEIVAELGCAKSTVCYHLGDNQRDKNLKRQRDRRNRVRRYIQETKHGKPCADCGAMFPYWVMDFDHVNGNKKFTIGDTTQSNDQTLEAVKAEIAKCEIVCANCHRDRTYQRATARRGKPIAGDGSSLEKSRA